MPVVDTIDRTSLLHVRGEIEQRNKHVLKTRDDLSKRADGPGVARGCQATAEDHGKAFQYTLVDQISTNLLAQPASKVPESGAHYLQAALSTARGDFDSAQEHLAAARELFGPGSGAGMLAYPLAVEAELALWQGRPEAASDTASKGEGVGLIDQQRGAARPRRRARRAAPGRGAPNPCR